MVNSDIMVSLHDYITAVHQGFMTENASIFPHLIVYIQLFSHIANPICLCFGAGKLYFRLNASF